MIKRILTLLLVGIFCFNQIAFGAQNIVPLQQPIGVGAGPFRPIHLRYLSYFPDTNNFKLFLDQGSINNPNEKQIQFETKNLLNYFFVGLALPNKTFWVNLKPNEQNNVIDERLAQTDVGRILLEADVQLKQDTAKFTSPKTKEGKEYWGKLFIKAKELQQGATKIKVPTLVRPWIVPDEITIAENNGSCYVYKATLKVMLEAEHLKEAGKNVETQNFASLQDYSAQLIKELIIPKLNKEINSSKRYAALRQVYYSLIIAQWFKERNKNNQFVGNGFKPFPTVIDSGNLTNLISKTPWSKDTYFNAYQKSFKEGEYNIKEVIPTATSKIIRTYTSGGCKFDFGQMPAVGAQVVNPATGGSVTCLSAPTDNLVPQDADYLVGASVNGKEVTVTALPSRRAAERAGLKHRAEEVLERPVTEPELDAIVRAHLVGQDKGHSYVFDAEGNPNHDKEFFAMLSGNDRIILNKILAADEKILADLMKQYPQRVYIKSYEHKEQKEGRTVYLELEMPIQTAGGIIRILRIKGIRPRYDQAGEVLEYSKGVGFVSSELISDSSGTIKSVPITEGVPYGTMLDDNAKGEYNMMKIWVSLPGVKTDYPVSWGVLKELLYKEQSVGFVIAGMEQRDKRILTIEHPGAFSVVTCYIEDQKTGERVELSKDIAREIYHKVGRILRAFHDRGYFHRYPTSENFGLVEREDGKYDVVLRDLDTNIKKRDFVEAPMTKAQEAAYRWFDLERSLYDAMEEFKDVLIAGYFYDVDSTNPNFVTAVSNLDISEWILQFERELYYSEITLASNLPYVGGLWSYLLSVSIGGGIDSSTGLPNPGGIDFTNLPIVMQAIDNLTSRDVTNLIEVNLKDKRKTISSIAEILREEEEQYSPTDPHLRDILIVLTANIPQAQLQQIFVGK